MMATSPGHSRLARFLVLRSRRTVAVTPGRSSDASRRILDILRGRAIIAQQVCQIPGARETAGPLTVRNHQRLRSLSSASGHPEGRPSPRFAPPGPPSPPCPLARSAREQSLRVGPAEPGGLQARQHPDQRPYPPRPLHPAEFPPPAPPHPPPP